MHNTTTEETANAKPTISTNTRVSIRKFSGVTEVWKDSQHLGDYSTENHLIKACKYASTGFTRQNFKNETEALQWIATNAEKTTTSAND